MTDDKKQPERTCSNCTHSLIRIKSPDGQRHELQCKRYCKPAKTACVDWKGK